MNFLKLLQSKERNSLYDYSYKSVYLLKDNDDNQMFPNRLNLYSKMHIYIQWSLISYKMHYLSLGA